jgi:hypothetical protein
MINLEDIKKDRELVDAIDWNMTPEEAITLYLEWGNNWSHGRMVKSRDDVSHYFVINSWETPPQILFIRRSSDGADELAHIDMPDEIREDFLASVHHTKGVWGLTEEVRDWLQTELNLN